MIRLPSLLLLLAVLAVGFAGATPARAATLSGREKDLYRLVEDQPKGVDDLVRVSGIPASAVSVVMLSLELRRLVKKAPGGWVRAV